MGRWGKSVELRHSHFPLDTFALTVKDEAQQIGSTAGTMAIKQPVSPPPLPQPPSQPLQDVPSPSAEKAPLDVLIVDDDQTIREMVARMVRGMGHAVYLAATGREALQRLQEHPLDIVLLDIMMPEMDGFEFCRIVQAEKKWPDLHIIITSARDTLEDKVKGLELGATDYLTKPFSMTELKARIRVGERIVRYRKALKEQQALLEYMAREDKLTGLYNRRHFEERAQEEWLRAHRYYHPLSLVFGDIDHFKKVNDRYGHAYGDKVLKEVSQTLLQHCRNNDLIARYGGEEFTVLLLETRLEDACVVAERLRAAVKALTFTHPSGPFQVTMSFGVACVSSEEPQSLTALLEGADKALYMAKHKVRNRVEQYTGSQLITPALASGTGKA